MQSPLRVETSRSRHEKPAKSRHTNITASTENNNVTNTTAHAHLQIHYDAMWDRAVSAITRGEMDCEQFSVLAGMARPV